MIRAGPPLKRALKPSSRSILIVNEGVAVVRLVQLTDFGECISKTLVTRLPFARLYLKPRLDDICHMPNIDISVLHKLPAEGYRTRRSCEVGSRHATACQSIPSNSLMVSQSVISETPPWEQGQVRPSHEANNHVRYCGRGKGFQKRQCFAVITFMKYVFF